MQPVKEAVATAVTFFGELFGPQVDVTLEEVELSDDEKFWLVTLGYGSRDLSGILGGRTYKVVRIRADSGAPVSVKIRKP